MMSQCPDKDAQRGSFATFQKDFAADDYKSKRNCCLFSDFFLYRDRTDFYGDGFEELKRYRSNIFQLTRSSKLKSLKSFSINGKHQILDN